MSSNFDLIKAVESLKLRTPFRGVFMRDELKFLKENQSLLKKEKECLILNLNDSKVSPEENSKTGHWCALFRDKEKKYFFCSYGSPIPNEVKEYLGLPILTHNFILQDFNSSICGELAVLILHLLDEGYSYFDAVLLLLEAYNEEEEEVKKKTDESKT